MLAKPIQSDKKFLASAPLIEREKGREGWREGRERRRKEGTERERKVNECQRTLNIP